MPADPIPGHHLDWARATLNGMSADYAWAKEPDIFAWLDRSRLNPTSGLSGRSGDAQVQQSVKRFVENVRPGLGRLAELVD